MKGLTINLELTEATQIYRCNIEGMFMKSVLVPICVLGAYLLVFSSECDSIVKRGFSYYCGDIKLAKIRDIRSALSDCPAACDQFETAYELGMNGSICAGIAVGCIGYNLASMMSPRGKEAAIRPLWAVGGACFGVGLIFAAIASNQKKFAVTKFNNQICHKTQSNQKITLNISFNSMRVTVDL